MINELTEDNPFFIEEVLQSFIDTGRSEAQSKTQGNCPWLCRFRAKLPSMNHSVIIAEGAHYLRTCTTVLAIVITLCLINRSPLGYTLYYVTN